MNSSKSWDLQIDPDVFKFLKRIPRPNAVRLLAAIKLLPVNPFFGDIEKMGGEENTWRRRIGAYRIFYKIKNVERIILTFRVERRTSSTY